MPFAGYTDFDDCVAKNSDKSNPDAYCGTIKNKVEESEKRHAINEANIAVAKEQDAQEPEGLTTPDAGDQKEGVTKDLISPQGSSREAENDQASGDGETSPADPPQDQAEPEANPQDQAKPDGQEVSPDSEIITNDKYGKLNGDKSAKNEDELKDERRDEHQGLEYNGESYHKVKAIEYEDEIYVQKDDKEEASEDDLEYEDDEYRKANEEDLELDDDIYVKDTEQAPMDIGGTTPTQPDINIPDLTATTESVIIRESNGRYKKYNIFQANEQEQSDPNVEQPAEVPDQPPVVEPQPEVAVQPQETKIPPVEQQDASEDIKAVEKIIIKENGKLKFRSVFTEVKKKA